MPVRPKGLKAKKIEAKKVEPERKTAYERGYNNKWRKARFHYLQSHPLCVHCDAEGRVTPATDLDHIIPHKGDMSLFWDSHNWQPLCKSCHSRKTVLEDGGFGNKTKQEY